MEITVQFPIKYVIIIIVLFLVLLLYYLQPRIRCSKCKKNRFASQVRPMKDTETGKTELVCLKCKPYKLSKSSSSEVTFKI